MERRTIIEEFGLAEAEFELACSRLERSGVCDVGRYVFPMRIGRGGTGPRRYDAIQLRPLGVALVDACRQRHRIQPNSAQLHTIELLKIPRECADSGLF